MPPASRATTVAKSQTGENAAQVAYHYLGPMSNRAVVELTEDCNISTIWMFMPFRAPGFLVEFTPPWH
jgi:hypothetical protein